MAATAVKTPDLAERLKADHLAEADLKDEIVEQDPGAKVMALDPNDPKGREEYTFRLRWTDGRSKLWEGEFTNKILSIGERQMAGTLRARFSNVAFDRLDALTSEINFITAHLTFSLKDKPEWAKNLRDLKDIALIQAIYEEVASHEATFFGLGQNP